MKLKNRILPAMLLFGVVSLSSCEKDEQDIANPTALATQAQEQTQLSQVMLDSSAVKTYSFSGKLLSQVNNFNKETGALETFEKYTRDAKGKVVKASTYAADTHTLLTEQAYTYGSDGQLSKAFASYYSDGKLAYTAYTLFEYNAAKKLVKKSFFEGREGAAAVAKSFTQYELLPNGDYSQEKQYVLDESGEPVLFATTTNSFDTNTNPFYAFAKPGEPNSPNNLIASAIEIHGSKKTLKYTYNYTYDAQKLPVSQTVTSPSGKTESFAYHYNN